MSNYATKADLKNATETDTSKLAAKSDKVSLKAEKDKIDKHKLKTVPVDLSKLSNLIKNEFIKKTVYDKLVTKKRGESHIYFRVQWVIMTQTRWPSPNTLPFASFLEIWQNR